ncbi:hypothetical protein SADUNF_Sadunf03G0035400 [Salix dunnii]|uniref:GPI ethanolamine phosphate transferase 3 n=1 Tax=Salix dunnii TaxID=1413687 RepID=A0A835N058_9ROSI|nr:hypothetical protein SADUNF_Sadunf03G0035400 [Salix dunnii]
MLPEVVLEGGERGGSAGDDEDEVISLCVSRQRHGARHGVDVLGITAVLQRHTISIVTRNGRTLVDEMVQLGDSGGSRDSCLLEQNFHITATGATYLNLLASPPATLITVGIHQLWIALSSLFSMQSEKKAWMDKLSVLQKMAFSEGSSAKIFKAIADPPTTSLQRLKGLATGGLPTFIDVGNSFGAPAIAEDNFIHQLVENGKRVMMMGDDTWIQLFPHHFNKSHPYPSFNVKDLHTVDNGCIEHLFPALYQEDWDVLIAHFLGVDHAGHIFGVDSMPMIEKLEQYNLMLEKVIEVLESQSEPGGLHENTFLLVMGDHGQTLNGDHGGGSAEEVETSIFAMSFKKPPTSIPSELVMSSCKLDLDGKKKCISSIQQLDFAVTVSALLGIPFPFGSIGRVNPELYALGAGRWNLDGINAWDSSNLSELEEWLLNYVNVLCINSWQVKRYIDVYSASSVIGFSSEDLLHISNVYVQAEQNWANTTKNLLLHRNERSHTLLPAFTRQIDFYFSFLSNVSELARSKWTEFNLKLMGIGLGTMLISLFIIFPAIQRVNNLYTTSLFSPGVEEGKVASFLLATTSIVRLRSSIMKKKMLFEAVSFLLLISILRFTIEVGLSKQAATSLFLSASPSWMLGVAPGHPLWTYMAEIGPILAVILLAFLLCRTICSSIFGGLWKYINLGTILSYVLIAVYWGAESNIPTLALLLQGMKKGHIPRMIYAIGLGQLLLVAVGYLFDKDRELDYKRSLVMKTVAILSAWSPTIIILSGKQGSLVVLALIIGGYCIVRLESMEDSDSDAIFTFNPLAITQWNLLAVFDEFALVRQAILLAIDTFGFSHILPVLGLPFLAVCKFLFGQNNHGKDFRFNQLSQMYMMYGLITATMVTVTIICVTIHRRHLMVWGLFAPKFVFDVAGLVLTDSLICLASLLYSGGPTGDSFPKTER